MADNKAETETLTEDQINAAVAASLEGASPDEGEPTDDPVEGEQAEDGAEPKGTMKFDPKKAQEQNRKLANLERELASSKESNTKLAADLAEIKELLKKPAETKAQAQTQDQAESILEELKDLQDEDSVDARTLKRVLGKVGNLLKNQSDGKTSDAEVKKQLAKLEAEIDSGRQDKKNESAFNEAYPVLKGQWLNLSERAYKEAIADLGDGAPDAEVRGAANSLLNRMARFLSKQNGKPKKPADTDNTAGVKPSQSTKGASNVTKGAAPKINELYQDADAINRAMAEQLQGD